jgi:hypothetical protein
LRIYRSGWRLQTRLLKARCDFSLTQFLEELVALWTWWKLVGLSADICPFFEAIGQGFTLFETAALLHGAFLPLLNMSPSNGAFVASFPPFRLQN